LFPIDLWFFIVTPPQEKHIAFSQALALLSLLFLTILSVPLLSWKSISALSSSKTIPQPPTILANIHLPITPKTTRPTQKTTRSTLKSKSTHSTMVSFSKVALLVSPFVSSTLARYTLAQNYTGRAFFDGFNFFEKPDPTNGHVKFIDKDDANKSGIAGFMSGGFANNAVYLGMDATNEAPDGRRAIRVESQQAFNHGLFIADIVHMPGGVCSTWPAFWLVGPNWPENGEIDILEGVNDQTSNKMALHTGPGAVISPEKKGFTGEMFTSNCDVNAPDQANNVGCLISDTDNATYGEGFNINGGGVYATEWSVDDIRIWFFPRDKIPADIASGNPQPSETWGVPRASFAGDYQVDDHFKDLKIVFDTTFCGDWAGAAWSASRCAALAPTCEEFVAKNSQAFREVYWAVNSLNVFTQTEDAPKERRRSGGAVLPALP
jgi:hypothetical protein